MEDSDQKEASCIDCREFSLPICGEQKCSSDIVFFEFGEFVDNLFFRHAGGEVFQNLVNRDTGIMDAGFSRSLSGRDSNPFLVLHGETDYSTAIMFKSVSIRVTQTVSSLIFCRNSV